MRVLHLTLVFPLLSACGNDIQVTQKSICNGQAEGDEDTVDAPYDADEDGYFDAANPDCAATYAAGDLDCDDQDPARHPGNKEATCDGVDNDCDDTTADDPGPDADQDGATACTDCDDDNPAVGPTLPEVACNGVDDDCAEATPDDDGTDADADGVTACTDCNDGNAKVNPGRAEETCNGTDDDCDDLTPDSPDGDGDGAGLCDDCNDTSDAQSPLLDEVCFDDLDNNCDGTTDESCVIDYNGVWTLDDSVDYSCAGTAVQVSMTTLTISGTTTSTAVTPDGRYQPGRMTGAFTSETALSVGASYAGTCTEDYFLDLTFTDDSHFTGSFYAQYTPSYSNACRDCANQSWSVAGSR